MARRKLTKNPKGPGGRPSSLKDEFIEQARILCANGALPSELADHFGVHRSTINDWKLKDEEFRDACEIGWREAARRVEGSLLELAIGQTLTDEMEDTLEEVDKDGNVTTKTRRRYHRRQQPGNIQAITKILDQHSRNFTEDSVSLSVDIKGNAEHVAGSFVTRILEAMKNE